MREPNRRSQIGFGSLHHVACVHQFVRMLTLVLANPFDAQVSVKHNREYAYVWKARAMYEKYL